MQNVTAIDDLPELEDLEGPRPMHRAIRPGGGPQNATPYGQDILPPKDSDDIYRKHIRVGRNIQEMPPEAGMSQLPRAPMHAPMEPMMDMEYYQPDQDVVHTKYNLPANSPTCIDCANHVDVCPVCKKYFDNDKTIYIIAIIVLTITCLLLLKKVLDV